MPAPIMEVFDDDELDLFGNEDCDTNDEVTAQSPAMPADLSLPDQVRKTPTEMQQRRPGWREDVALETDEDWLSPNNPAIWEGDEPRERRADFGPSVIILGDE